MAGGARRLDGFWLPGLDADALSLEERRFGPGEVTLRLPRLTPDQLSVQLDSLLEARGGLAARPIGEILPALEAAAAAITRPEGAGYDELVRTLPGLTGYSRRMIELGLERTGRNWTASALASALEGELGSLEVLDEFRARAAGGLHRAFGPGLTVHVFSGNIPGVSVSSLIRAFCVKSASFGKTAVGEPYLAARFARALADVDAELGRCVAVTYWPGGQAELERVAFERAEAVVVYGADSTVADVRRRLPAATRFIGYPNRVGAGIVLAGALDRPDEWARRAATDVIAFDQHGCVSPHVLFVEKGGPTTPSRFAERLAAALEEASGEIPRGSLSAGESSAIHQARGSAEMRGATVWASEGGTAWTVIFEDDPAFEPSPLNRVVHVRAVADAEEALAALESVAGWLQTVALACDEGEIEVLAGRLGALGATRIVPMGQASWPSPGWHHDGRFQFLDLLRFTDVESD